MTDFFKLPFCYSWKEVIRRAFKGLSLEIARPYTPRIYINIDFIKELNLDIKNLTIYASYGMSSLSPSIWLLDGGSLHKYIRIGSTEQSEKEAKEEGRPVLAPDARLVHIGYKHFDRWKYRDGSQIGDINPGVALKLQRLIQCQVLGAAKYYYLRLKGTI